MTKLPSAKILLEHASAIYKKHLYLFLGILLLGVIPGLVVALPGTYLLAHEGGSPLLEVVVGAVLVAVFSYIFIWTWSALVKAISLVAEDKSVSVKHSFLLTRKMIPQVFIASLLYGLIVFGGMILLVIPGLIFAVWYGKANYIVITEGLSAKAALKKSRAYLRKRFWPVVGRVVVILILGTIISVFLALLLSFIMGAGPAMKIVHKAIFDLLWLPFQIIYSFLIYRALKDTYQEQPVQQ